MYAAAIQSQTARGLIGGMLGQFRLRCGGPAPGACFPFARRGRRAHRGPARWIMTPRRTGARPSKGYAPSACRDGCRPKGDRVWRDLGIAGFHFFTFNDLIGTRAWELERNAKLREAGKLDGQ